MSLILQSYTHCGIPGRSPFGMTVAFTCEGAHERAVINVAKFTSKMAQKAG